MKFVNILSTRFLHSKDKLFDKNNFLKNQKTTLKNDHQKFQKNKNLSKYYKPVFATHLSYCSNLFKRVINVFSRNRSITFYKNSEKPKIEIEYIKNDTSISSYFTPGHYTLKKNKEPYFINKYPNNCLYDVISSQTGMDANYLRYSIIRKMRKTRKKFLSRNVMDLKRFSCNREMQGGARYKGRSEKFAKKILDSSQKSESHPTRKSGHPRGHASHPEVTKINDSVENYSLTGRKTGFLSRSDQDLVTHLALKHNKAQDAMELLNELGEDGVQEVIVVQAKELEMDEDELPDVQEWLYGKTKGEPGRMKELKAVLKHYYNEYDNEQKDVFVYTLYPVM